jgi:hypothetical protein
VPRHCCPNLTLYDASRFMSDWQRAGTLAKTRSYAFAGFALLGSSRRETNKNRASPCFRQVSNLRCQNDSFSRLYQNSAYLYEKIRNDLCASTNFIRRYLYEDDDFASS